MRPAKEFAEHRWNRSSFAEVARDLFSLLKPTRVIVNLGHHVPNSGRHALRVVRSAEHPTGLKAKGLLHLYRQLHDSLTVAVPSQSIVWFGTIQPADDGGPHSADEVALALKVFPRAFNTSEYTDHWTREQDFLDDFHVNLHGNVILARGLMRFLYPHARFWHAALAERASQLESACCGGKSGPDACMARATPHC